jgi:lipid-A-disaccharide synthase
MPGSRKGEIKKLLPIFKEVQKKLGIESTIIIPKHFTKEDIKEVYGSLSGFKTAHDAHKALLEADFAFICSGTATLEASLIGTPFVLTYIARPLDYYIANKLVKLDYIGLANIMFSKLQSRALHPELIQESVSAKNLLKAYDEYDRSRFLEDSKALREYLKHGSSKRVAKIIENLKQI